MGVGYLYLIIAIVAEVCATTGLPSTQEFTRVVPSIAVLIGYATALFFLSLTLRSVPVGIAYAIWAGVGTAGIAMAGYFIHHQVLDARAIAGMALIVAGVVLVNTSPSATLH